MKNCSLFILVTLFLTSCAVTHSPAPIQYNHKNAKLVSSESVIPVINNGGITRTITKKDDGKPEVIVPYDDNDYALPEPIEKDKKFIYHEVQVGEEIEDVSLQYGQSVAEIAKLNNLSAPYDLEEFQILKIKIDKKAEKKILATEVKHIDKVQDKPLPPSVEYIKPLNGKVISKFGEKTDFGSNKGINIAAKTGTKILATADGKVIYADRDGTFGNLVIIKLSGKNIVTSYAHLEDLVLSKGDSVMQGDVVGYVGSTGKVKTPQLHFAIREGKKAKDPLLYVQY